MKQCIKGFIVCLLFAGCVNNQSRTTGLPPSDPNNGGLFLPKGFEALVVADSTGRAYCRK